jgi:protein-tyrosine phosphatase
MAEYLFRQMLADRKGCPVSDLADQGYAVSSCGTLGLAGGAASTGSSEELSRRGIDASGHRSQPLSVELIQQAERIYVMTPEHRNAVLDLVPAAASKVEQLDPDNPVPDPISGGPQEYRRCAEQIERAAAARVEEFLNEDLNW